MANKNLRDYVLMTVAQSFVGMGIVGSKYLVMRLPIFFFLEIRFLISTIILFGLAKFLEPQQNNLTTIDWLIIIAQSLCAGFLFNIFMITGLRFTSANIAAITTSALPAMISIMSFLFLREKLSAEKTFCILLATIGLVLINFSKFIHTGAIINSSLLGNLFILISLLPEAAFYILTKIKKISIPVFTLSFWINGINTLVFLPFAISEAWSKYPFTITLYDVCLLLILGIMGALFYVFWYIGSARVQASLTALFTAAMPISALIMAWISLNETLTPLQFIGLIFVLLSISVGIMKIKPILTT